MNDYGRLINIYDEISKIVVLQGFGEGSELWRTWKMKAERFFLKRYGESSIEWRQFQTISASEQVPDRLGLLEVKRFLSDYLKELKEEYQIAQRPEQQETKDYRRVFIVHGHDDGLKEAVARLIEKQGVEAIILHEQENLGATIIEKIEKYSGVQAAICLFTADDLGRKKDAPKEAKRARQNVVFEAGYFIGKLGRRNTVILSDKDIEMPSDLAGVVYVGDDWRYQVLKELKAIGYEIDFQKM